jgi:hypothetical protein
MVNALKKPHLWHENDQIVEIFLKDDSNDVESHMKWVWVQTWSWTQDHLFKWLFTFKYSQNILRIFCLKVGKIKFDPKRCYNVLTCKYMFKELSQKYIMFKKFP